MILIKILSLAHDFASLTSAISVTIIIFRKLFIFAYPNIGSTGTLSLDPQEDMNIKRVSVLSLLPILFSFIVKSLIALTGDKTFNEYVLLFGLVIVSLISLIGSYLVLISKYNSKIGPMDSRV